MPKKSAQMSLADLHPAAGGVSAVDKAITVLAAFTDANSTLSLSEIAQHTRLYKSAVLRLLASLEHGRLVTKHADGRYGIGPEVGRLNALYASSFSLEDLALPLLRQLVAQTQESAAFHVRQGDQRLCLYRVDSPQMVRDHIKAGDLLPLDRGAGGRVLSAYSGAKGALYDRIRRDGVVLLQGDRSPDLCGISAPVLRRGTELVGAITLTMPTHRLNPDHEPLVRVAAQEMSRKLDFA
ncbi:IclR family transcriptional regulator [Alcaligenaceae bacterium C4P045]|nr:IclR family transcriptional regulator [Alcaligenaceae bacterium C4P045]